MHGRDLVFRWVARSQFPTWNRLVWYQSSDHDQFLHSFASSYPKTSIRSTHVFGLEDSPASIAPKPSGYRCGASTGITSAPMLSQLRTIWTVLSHTFKRNETVEYPEEMPYQAPRYRGRIILTRDPDGEERCVACNLCAVACPVDCIALQKTEKEEDGRWYPEFFRINFSRCIMCGLCEEACPTKKNIYSSMDLASIPITVSGMWLARP